MGWRFRKSFKILPGVRVNLGKGSISVSLGGKGITINIGKHGTRTTVSIPGTGWSYSTQTKGQKTQPISASPLPNFTQHMAKKKSGKWFYVVGAMFVGAWLISRQAATERSALPRFARTVDSDRQPLTSPVSRIQPTPEITPPAITAPSPLLPSPTAAPSAFPSPLLSSPTAAPSASPSPLLPSPTAAPSPLPTAEPISTYHVAGVQKGDFLNLREGPGQNHPIVQRLQNGVDGIVLIGEPINNAGTVWQKLESRGIQGWAVRTYLAPDKEVKKAKPAKNPSVREPKPPRDNYVPKEVRLTSLIDFPVFERGVQIGLAAPPIGTKVKLLKITGYNVLVEYEGRQKTISASSTDLLERMLGTSDD